MQTKITRQDLEDFELVISGKLQDIVNKFYETFMTKDEILRRFAAINKKIKEIMELLKNKQQDEYDAMLSKKHVNMACASCEKDLINMSGMRVDHNYWNAMPKRDQTDRIARYGQGFSKLLSNI